MFCFSSHTILWEFVHPPLSVSLRVAFWPAIKVKPLNLNEAPFCRLLIFVSGWWAVCHRKPLISVQEPLAGDSFALSPHLLEWKRLITVSSLRLSWVSVVFPSEAFLVIWAWKSWDAELMWGESRARERHTSLSDLHRLQTSLFYITERICDNEGDS